MSSDDFVSRLQRIVSVTRLGSPCSLAAIQDAEKELGHPLPQPLRVFYLACDGFRGPYHVELLWPLFGDNNLVRFNKFFRLEPYAPSWVGDVVFFGDDGVGGSVGRKWAFDWRHPTEVIEYMLQDGERKNIGGADAFEVWRRVQREFDEIDAAQQDKTSEEQRGPT